MLVSIIYKDKNRYYVNLNKKENKNVLSIICANSNGTRCLDKEEALSLFNELLYSKLKYKEKENDYDVYLDENNNKRYFKGKIEDYKLLFQNNGVSAIKYKDDTEYRHSKLYRFAIAILVVNPILIFNLIDKKDIKLFYEKAEYITSDMISEEEIENYINNTDGLTKEQKDLLKNKELFDDLLYYADRSRNYELRDRLSNISIDAYGNENALYSKDSGFYNALEPSIIHLNNNVEDTDEVLCHEFVHLLQANTKYLYIDEASAELISHEYYNTSINSYVDSIQRLRVLMEIIGPQPIMEYNFSNSSESLENAIREYLTEEESKKMLELLTFSGQEVISNPDRYLEVNDELDKLLEKMYFNKYNESIDNNKLINNIYAFTNVDRTYFNRYSDNFYDDYYCGDNITEIDTLKLDIENDNVKNYVYYKTVYMSEEEYNDMDKSDVASVERQNIYHAELGYSLDENKYIYNNNLYSFEESKELGLIERRAKVVKNIYVDNFSDIEFDQTGKVIINYKDGTYGEFYYTHTLDENNKLYCDKLNDMYISDVRHYSKEAVYMPSIANKFKEQIIDENIDKQKER